MTMTYSLASAAALFLSSSLYFVAAFEVYFVFGSWFARAAIPPCDWKNFVADSLPPTFMVRSWSHCHSAYPLHHYSDSWEVRMIKAYGQGLLIWQMKYGLLDCGDLRSNRGTSIYQTAPKTRLGFWFRSQSIPIIYQRRVSIDQERGMHTLFAGFAFNFSKIFCDWVFVAELMLQRRNGKSRSSPYERKPITPKSSNKLLSWKRQIRVEKL